MEPLDLTIAPAAKKACLTDLRFKEASTQTEFVPKLTPLTDLLSQDTEKPKNDKTEDSENDISDSESNLDHVGPKLASCNSDGCPHKGLDALGIDSLKRKPYEESLLGRLDKGSLSKKTVFKTGNGGKTRKAREAAMRILKRDLPQVDTQLSRFQSQLIQVKLIVQKIL